LKISLITVSYNSVQTIRSTINSVLSQDYPDVEYIIIDGGSLDGTVTIIDEYRAQISRVLSEPDKGMYDAMNKGIQLATGDIIGILNSDDVYEGGGVLSNIAQIFIKNPGVDLVFGDVVFTKADAPVAIVRHYHSMRFKLWKLRIGWMMPPHPATFVRREVYRNFGLYSLDYQIAADFEMFIRWLLIHKLNYFSLNRILVRMRMGGASTSGFKNSLLLNREIVRACKMNGFYTNLAVVLGKLPWKLLELVRTPHGA